MTRPNDEPPEWAKEQARNILADDAAPDTAADTDSPTEATESTAGSRVPDIPASAVDEAARLTRLARETEVDTAAAFYRERRNELVTSHDYVPRLRESDDTLVLYPEEWMADGTAQLDRIETTDRAVEVSLSGPGDADRYRAIAAYNDAVADAVADRSSSTHAATADSFAAFMSNHYLRGVDDSTPAMRAEFREEFLPRNGWPTDEQLERVEESLSVIESIAETIEEPEA